MRIESLTNRIITIQDSFRGELLSCKAFSIASAFIDEEAISLIEYCLSKNRQIKEARLIIGVYGCFNRKADLERLNALAGKHAIKLQIRISRDRNFHWKYYHFSTSRKQALYIGSANFTTGGMLNNGELMIKLTDALLVKVSDFASVLSDFEKEWSAGGSIGDFKIADYRERPLLKSKLATGETGNKVFFDAKINESRDNISEKAVVIFLTANVSPQTEKMIKNAKSSWKNNEFFCSPTKSLLEQCKSMGNLIFISRQGRDRFSAYYATFEDSLKLRTPDGNFFVAYNIISKEIELKQSIIDKLTDKNTWGFKLKGRVNVLKTKVLGKNQVTKMKATLGL